MAKGFRIPLIADVTDWLRGTRQMEDSLEDVGDSLDNLAREAQRDGKDIVREFERTGDDLGDSVKDGTRDAERHLDDLTREAKRGSDDVSREFEKAGDDLGDAFKDGGREAERHLDDVTDEVEKVRKDVDSETERMEKSFRDAFREVESDSKKMGDDVGRNAKRGMDDAERATDTFKDEARQNLSESVSSFRGDIEDIPQLFQDILGGVSADLGPAGAIGTLIGAAGLGIAAGFYEHWKENAEKVEDRISDMYSDMLESGQDYLSQQYIQDAFHGIITGADDAVISLGELKKVSEETGLSQEEIALAYAGDLEAGADLTDALTRKRQELNDVIADPTASDAVRAQAGQQTRDIDRMIEGWEEQGAAIQTSTERIQNAREVLREHGYAIEDGASAARDWAAAQAEADDVLADAQEQIETNNEEIDNNSARMDENVGVLADLIGSNLDAQEALRNTGASTSDLTALQRQQADQFVRTARAAGIEEDAALDLAVQLGLIPEDVATDIRTEGTDTASRKAKDIKRDYERIPTEISTRIRAEVNQTEWQRQIDAAAGRLVIPTVKLPVTSQFRRPV